MEWAKQLGVFITIKFNDLDIAGKFGVGGITSDKYQIANLTHEKKSIEISELINLHHL